MTLLERELVVVNKFGGRIWEGRKGRISEIEDGFFYVSIDGRDVPFLENQIGKYEEAKVDPNANLLDLMKLGARVTFSNGGWIEGETDDKYIVCGTEFGWIGRWLLNEEGLKDALEDVRKEIENGENNAT